MSTLVLALALCSVPVNTPERVSADVEQSWMLMGSWEGALANKKARYPLAASQREDGLLLHRGDEEHTTRYWLVNEGRGRFRLEENDGTTYFGIYRWERGRVALCVGLRGRGRPTSFLPTDDQWSITLRRGK